ncbi:MAG: hypothetical protein ACTSVV_04100, partial [Promethearchaeota archaeon]
IDLLPAFKISINNFLKKTIEEKVIYKPHMSIYHIKFVNDRGQKFQEFCRLAKYFVNGPENTNKKVRLTSSFFVELIAAIVFDYNIEHKENWNLVQLYEAFLIRVKNLKLKRRYIAFSDFFTINDFKDNWNERLSVIDPVDPDDNIVNKNPQKLKLNELIEKSKDALELWKQTNFEIVFQKYFSKHPP